MEREKRRICDYFLVDLYYIKPNTTNKRVNLLFLLKETSCLTGI